VLSRALSDGKQRTSLDALELRDLGDLHGDNERPIEREVRPGDVKAIMYTSGTTGKSKGVMVSHVHAYEYANGCASVIDIGESDIYYTAGLPLFHVAGKWGVLLGSAIKGATAVVPLRFSASNFWADIRRHQATATYLLGAMANFLQRQPRTADDRRHTLRKILMCPLLPDLDDFIDRFGVGWRPPMARPKSTRRSRCRSAARCATTRSSARSGPISSRR
jgi:crotonobetaine/carnitine-CoA ligase